ncbi:unnamed protein product [Schistosoma curassoni]|uniref:SMC_N domain-containing protein n=1 Tax=Schistosoma curassoni TaxID=6186 RepID=A0A183JPR5_9TREM|nr:unnamed protein product [Schistosoma curassoni]
MYIKSLVIDGFKSYCQRTEIDGFDPQFNAITGLNGSGKSNILDAICFLLGITNLSHILTEDINPTIKKLREERSSYLEYQKVVREINHLEKFIVAYDYTCLEEAKKRTKGDLVTLERSLDEQKKNMEEHQGTALEELESTMSACQKTEAVAKGASQRASESLRAAKQRVKSMESQCMELDEQLSSKHKAAEAAAGIEYQSVLAQSEEAKVKFEAAQKRLQAVKSGLSSGENGVAASLAEQVRVADGEKCSAQTELSQLKMRQKHLQNELAKQEAIVVKTFGHGSIDGESKEEMKQKELTAHIDELTKKLTRAEADDRSVGSESVLSGK